MQYHAGQSPPRRGADSTNHRVATWQSASPSRGRFVAGCPGVKSRPEYSFHCPPMLTRGRAVVGWLPGIRPGPPKRAPRWSWEGMEWVPSLRNQPEARTNAHCSVTAPVRYLRRMCEDLNLRRQRGGHAGWCVCGGCGEGVRGEPRR